MAELTPKFEGKDKALADTIVKLGARAYMVEIQDELEQQGIDLSLGHLYVTLGRWERLGFVNSRQEPGGEERNFQPRRHYKMIVEYA